MKKGEMLNKMIVLAATKHDGMFDKGGNPYILHPLSVMYILNSTDEELQCIAVRYDLIEDTATTYKELAQHGFTTRIIEGIRSLTKVPGEDYEEYKEKVKKNPDAVKVKMADLMHNTDIKRLKGVSAKDISRMERYYVFFLELKSITESTQ